MENRLVPSAEAMQFTGHRTQSAFSQYIRRINQALPPEKRVIRIAGRYDMNSLKQAVAVYCRREKAVAE